MKPPQNSPLMLVSLSMLTLLVGCSGSDTDHEFFPLFEDLQWQYRVERKTMDGHAELRYSISTVAPGNRQPGTDATRETLTGHRYYYEINDEGVFQVGETVGGIKKVDYHDKKKLVLPRRLAPSQTWISTTHTAVLESSRPPWEKRFRIHVPVEMRYRVDSLSGHVETPAGKVSGCAVVSGFGVGRANISSSTDMVEVSVATKEWFAPKVGLVRMERLERTDMESVSSGSLEMELDFWQTN